MTIKGILLAGVALCSISLSPALAKSAAPHIHVLAAHPGAAMKTVMQHKTTGALTYTFFVYESVSASSVKQKTPLVYTFYTWDNSYDICDQPKSEKITLSTKKTTYAKLSTGVETYPGSLYGCSGGGSLSFYGDVYELTAKKASGAEDSFVSDLKAKIHDTAGKFNASLNLDVTVFIE
jgi:hypothetical protein